MGKSALGNLRSEAGERPVRVPMYRFWVLKFGLGNWTFLLPIVSSVWFLPSRERGHVGRESKAGVGTRALAPDVTLPNGTVTSLLSGPQFPNV